MKIRHAIIVLALSASVAYAATPTWSRIPSCWVINCRAKSGNKCVACISLNCSAVESLLPVAVLWCNRWNPNIPGGGPRDAT